LAFSRTFRNRCPFVPSTLRNRGAFDAFCESDDENVSLGEIRIPRLYLTLDPLDSLRCVGAFHLVVHSSATVFITRRATTPDSDSEFDLKTDLSRLGKVARFSC